MVIRNLQQPVHHIEIKRHHKIIFGSLSSLIIIILILNSVFLYLLYTKIELQYNHLESNLNKLEADTNSKFGEVTTSILTNQEMLISLDSSFGDLSSQFNSLKASAGEDFSGIIEESVKGVVTIRTDLSQGTGFIITNDGYIVTNYHVIEGAKAATIITSNSENHQVALVGFNSEFDIALLKISGSFDKLTLGNSNEVSVGEKVIAIGNPLGLQFSVSQGIVSAIHRQGANEINAYIQTDAALNPGNSGGPLINTAGKVIGINNFKIGDSESLGFALESNYIKQIINEISQQAISKELL